MIIEVNYPINENRYPIYKIMAGSIVYLCSLILSFILLSLISPWARTTLIRAVQFSFIDLSFIYVMASGIRSAFPVIICAVIKLFLSSRIGI